MQVAEGFRRERTLDVDSIRVFECIDEWRQNEAVEDGRRGRWLPVLEGQAPGRRGPRLAALVKTEHEGRTGGANSLIELEGQSPHNPHLVALKVGTHRGMSEPPRQVLLAVALSAISRVELASPL